MVPNWVGVGDIEHPLVEVVSVVQTTSKRPHLVFFRSRRSMQQRQPQRPPPMPEVSLRPVPGGRHEPQVGPQQRAEEDEVQELLPEKGPARGQPSFNHPH